MSHHPLGEAARGRDAHPFALELGRCLHRAVVAHDQRGLARRDRDDADRTGVLAFGDQRQIRPARDDDVEAARRQCLMRARRPAEVGALDVEAVLGEQPAIDAYLQRHKGDRGRNGDADAHFFGGRCRRRQQQRREQQDSAKTMNHRHDPTHFTGTLSRTLCAGAPPFT
jgi:hypothetical protein